MTKLNNELLPSANKKRKKTKYQRAHLTSKRTVVFTLSQYFMIFYPTIGWRNLKCQHFTEKQTCILISRHFVFAIFLPLLLCCIPFRCLLTVNYYFSAIFIINFPLVVRSNVMPLHEKKPFNGIKHKLLIISFGVCYVRVDFHNENTLKGLEIQIRVKIDVFEWFYCHRVNWNGNQTRCAHGEWKWRQNE